MKIVLAALAFAFTLCVGLKAEAATTILNYDNGYIAASGLQSPNNNPNMLVGGYGGFDDYRNWFAFNLTALALSGAQIHDATLSIVPNGGYLSGDRSETIGFFDFVGGNITHLTGRGGGAAAWQNLGSGNSYGEVTVFGERPWFGPMQEINVALTQQAIADINRALATDDPRFVIGGAMLTPSFGGIYPEFVWSGSGGGAGPHGARLIINAETPLPGALALFIGGLAILGGLGWKKRGQHQRSTGKAVPARAECGEVMGKPSPDATPAP